MRYPDGVATDQFTSLDELKQSPKRNGMIRDAFKSLGLTSSADYRGIPDSEKFG
ncbi:MAG: hypothetical protein ACKPEN_11775 [Planktothrix sp.]|uniref:hypothetical protein n=1 Tax=Planktothrix sp. TaxID=3088171 RepID=UPI0038D39B79